MDYGTRTILIAPVFFANGDYAADLPVIQAIYRGAVGLHRDKFVVGEGK